MLRVQSSWSAEVWEVQCGHVVMCSGLWVPKLASNVHHGQELMLGYDGVHRNTVNFPHLHACSQNFHHGDKQRQNKLSGSVSSPERTLQTPFWDWPPLASSAINPLPTRWLKAAGRATSPSDRLSPHTSSGTTSTPRTVTRPVPAAGRAESCAQALGAAIRSPDPTSSSKAVHRGSSPTTETRCPATQYSPNCSLFHSVRISIRGVTLPHRSGRSTRVG